jgi:hypothetical protein
MQRIYIDLTENEDKPLIKELITCNQCVNRVMNDVSKGLINKVRTVIICHVTNWIINK